MEIKVLDKSKEEIKVEFDSVTLVELFRVYLNKDSSVDLAVWKREHPTKNPVLLVKGKDVSKSLSYAADAATKDLDSFEDEFKSLK